MMVLPSSPPTHHLSSDPLAHSLHSSHSSHMDLPSPPLPLSHEALVNVHPNSSSSLSISTVTPINANSITNSTSNPVRINSTTTTNNSPHVVPLVALSVSTSPIKTTEADRSISLTVSSEMTQNMEEMVIDDQRKAAPFPFPSSSTSTTAPSSRFDCSDSSQSNPSSALSSPTLALSLQSSSQLQLPLPPPPPPSHSPMKDGHGDHSLSPSRPSSSFTSSSLTIVSAVSADSSSHANSRHTLSSSFSSAPLRVTTTRLKNQHVDGDHLSISTQHQHLSQSCAFKPPVLSPELSSLQSFVPTPPPLLPPLSSSAGASVSSSAQTQHEKVSNGLAAPFTEPAPPSSSSVSSSPSPGVKKKAISYAAERVIGNGSFGIVYQATVIDTQETVAIKKVLQDRRFKNRELELMSSLAHPNVVALRHCFYSKGEKPDEIYLNLVMEYISETIHRTLRNHTKANKLVPLLYTKVYMYQIVRALAYIHYTGICHRDIKPQNLLLNPKTHEVKLCDFGSAKSLKPGEPNVSYICSRYYRAPELVFEATEYSNNIDIWSLGCVFVELLIGTPLFPGESGVGQLIEIIKVLGSPSREDVLAMNPAPTSFRFPHIAPQPWSRVFRNARVPVSAIDLASKWLRYRPSARLNPFDSLLHPFFEELREQSVRMPNGREPPPLFEWKDSEIQRMLEQGGVPLYEAMTPAWARSTTRAALARLTHSGSGC